MSAVWRPEAVGESLAEKQMAGLPPLIVTMIDAINRGDFDGFFAAFHGDGEVNDWNRSFKGRDAIKGWSDTELIGAKGTLKVTKVLSDTGGTIAFDGDWTSSYYSGPGRFTITIRDGKISVMRISEA